MLQTMQIYLYIYIYIIIIYIKANFLSFLPSFHPSIRPDFQISRTVTPRALKFGKPVELLKLIHNQFQVFQGTFTRAIYHGPNFVGNFTFLPIFLKFCKNISQRKLKDPFFFCLAQIGPFEPFCAKERENLQICIFEKIKILTLKNIDLENISI